MASRRKINQQYSECEKKLIIPAQKVSEDVVHGGITCKEFHKKNLPEDVACGLINVLVLLRTNLFRRKLLKSFGYSIHHAKAADRRVTGY
jgi:hypothetical protein